ncbi:MAG: response regulator [Terriglobales bacterium]
MARKILLADDSVTAQNMGRKILADAGYDVVTVNNGSAALKRITEIKPDLIVLDVYMPGYSGLEVCQRLKDSEETAHIPVLLTVGKLEPFKPEEARRVRADAHIVKPFEASELLTAITRLEDRIVPQQSAGRFGAEGNGRKSDYTPGGDNGWKSRLGFPSKKKKDEKEEAEEEDFTSGAGFRDFRKGKSKAGAGGTALKTAGVEPGLVPDIPRDITPQELDALSALAAKLDGPAPAAEFAVAKTEAEVAGADADKRNASENEGKIVAETPAVEAAAVGVAVESAAAVEIPVEHVEAVVEGAAGVAEAVAVETRPAENQHLENQQSENQPAEAKNSEVVHSELEHSEVVHSENQGPETLRAETPAAAVAVEENIGVNSDVNTEVNTALLAEDAAPVDRNDEPGFATAAVAVEQVSEESGAKLAEAFAVTQSEAPETAAAPNVQGVEATEERAPSDEELAEALRLLTPSTGKPDVSSSPSTIPSSEGLAAAGQLLAEEVARSAAAGSRWVAEPVALSPEEAALSLEAEMFRTFGAMPGGEIGPAPMTAVSAIEAAVENRLAAVGLAASALPEAAELPLPEHVSSENSSDEHSSVEPGSAEQGAEQQSSEIVSVETSGTFSHQPSAIGDQPVEVEKITPEPLAAEAKDSPAAVVEEAPEIAAATFADMVGQNADGQGAVGQSGDGQDGIAQDGADGNKVGEGASDAAAEVSGESVGGTATAVGPELAEENRDSSSEVEGQEAMGKEVKSKSGKSNWHQIHSAPASAAAKVDVVEAAKGAEAVPEEAPKAMAAAATAAPTSVPDASTIASIVDSVMADLRPKIVEEIAKKLAGK